MKHFFNTFMGKAKSIFTYCLMLGFLWAHPSQAQDSTHTISYQGFLYENNQPFTGKKDFVFSLLDAQRSVWTETQPAIDVNEGRYTVVLGVNTPLTSSIFEQTNQLKLRIEVGGVTLSPDVQLHAVPYAIAAAHAKRANEAVYAKDASHAKLADNATTAEHAKTADQVIDTPSFDSQWFSIDKNCSTYSFDLGFNGLPKRIMAYYKLATGQILVYGMSQYGDGGQANGVLLDLNELGKLYVRLPCGNQSGNQSLHLGHFKDRQNDGNQGLNSQVGVQFRVLVWK